METKLKIPKEVKPQPQATLVAEKRRCKSSHCGHCTLRSGNKGPYCDMCATLIQYKKQSFTDKRRT